VYQAAQDLDLTATVPGSGLTSRCWWTAGRSTPRGWTRGRINLTAGQRYAVRLEYHDLAGEAGVRLLWSAPGLTRQVVPASQIFP